MLLRKLKYPLLILMLHVLFASCNIRYEFASISHYERGCFHSISSELILYREEGKLMAALSVEGHQIELKQLDKKQLNYFNSFVGELMKKNEVLYCTTQEDYNLSMNGITYHYRDGSCRWNGFDNLCAELFKEPVATVTQP